MEDFITQGIREVYVELGLDPNAYQPIPGWKILLAVIIPVAGYILLGIVI